MIVDSFCSYACGGAAWWLVPLGYVIGLACGAIGAGLWFFRDGVWR